MQQLATRIGIVRIDRQHAREIPGRLAIPAQRQERVAPVVQRVGIGGHERDRALVVRERLLHSPQRLQDVAPVVVGACQIGLDGDGLSVNRKRLVEPVEIAERVAERIECLGVIWTERLGPDATLQRFTRTPAARSAHCLARGAHRRSAGRRERDQSFPAPPGIGRARAGPCRDSEAPRDSRAG